MDRANRREFFRKGTLGLAAAGIMGIGEKAEAQFVWRAKDWRLAEFEKLTHHPARVKQVFDMTEIASGKGLGAIKNCLNELHFGFDVPVNEIKLAGGLHGPANLLNYDDFVWKKYRVGEWLGVKDPATGAAAERNLFYGARAASVAAEDPSDPRSRFQDASMQTLMARGVMFLSCHTALEEQVRELVALRGMKEEPEEIVREMLAHAQPGVLVVASMGAAIALLQRAGRFSYLRI